MKERFIVNKCDKAANSTGQEAVNALAPKSEAALEKERLQKAENAAKLKEVEQQQEEFGEKK